MFEKTSDERLSVWADFRKSLATSDNPLEQVTEFWSHAPRIIHNHLVDPYYSKSWPTPWEIIVNNRYDDFTIALMIAYTLKLSDRFKNNKIEIKTLVDSSKTSLYNLVYIDDTDVLNYDSSPIKAQDLKEDLYLENIIEIVYPR